MKPENEKLATDTISRAAAIDTLTEYGNGRAVYIGVEEAVRRIKQLPSAEPERKTGRLSNQEWIDFLVERFDVSRTTAKSMLHAMMRGKCEDNFKKQFSGARREMADDT